jgi:hypothetical protein
MPRTGAIPILILIAMVVGCSRENKTFTAPAVLPVPTISYPATGGSGNFITRGFYIPQFPGTSLSGITLWHSGSAVGSYTFRLTARSATYDGTVIDQADATVFLSGNSGDSTRTNYAFPKNATITAGSTVTFTITQLAGPSTAFKSIAGDFGGRTGADINLIETVGTTPPLDTRNRDGIAILLRGRP